MNLTNQFLIAMPNMGDPRFHQAVVYICEHSNEGSMGLIINKPLDLNMEQVFEELNINPASSDEDIFLGGPVSDNTGFVLHSGKKLFESSLNCNENLILTTSVDVLKDISSGVFENNWRFYLGYSGWSELQLEEEINQNAWLTCPADHDLIFNEDSDLVWHKSLQKLGITDPSKLFDAGHA